MVRIYESDECIICTEKFSNRNPPLALECGHQFHGKCLVNWGKEQLANSNEPSCPLDRKPSKEIASKIAMADVLKELKETSTQKFLSSRSPSEISYKESAYRAAAKVTGRVVQALAVGGSLSEVTGVTMIAASGNALLISPDDNSRVEYNLFNEYVRPSEPLQLGLFGGVISLAGLGLFYLADKLDPVRQMLEVHADKIGIEARE